MQLVSPARTPRERPENLAERIYQQLKDDIFEFRLLPGDRFSEGEVAERMAVSRTPVQDVMVPMQVTGVWACRAASCTASRADGGAVNTSS